MRWLFLLIGVPLLAGAMSLAPPPAVEADRDELPPPPTTPALTTMALGRRDAAADMLWLRTVQFIGSPNSEHVQYAGMETWVERISDLSPQFGLPYLVAGLLLCTSPKRADAADRLLERGERLNPTDVQFPMTRGFVAYFGKLDAAIASKHYLRAAGYPDAPPYLKPFGERIARESQSCAEVSRNLHTVYEQGGEQARIIRTEAERILSHCAESHINRAATSYSLEHGRNPKDLEELRGAGLLPEPPFTPPHQCWKLKGDRAFLEPCQ